MIRMANFRYPHVAEDVVVFPYVVLGQRPLPNAANRRQPVDSDLGSIGARTILGTSSIIYEGVNIGEDCRLGDRATVREGCRIGDRCVIGTLADIQYEVTIGNDVRILNGAQIAGTSSIGDGTFIGPGVQTANDPHLFGFDLDDYQDRGQTGVTIGRKVKIGVGAIILPGVSIGDEAIIAAGALVTKDVQPGDLIMSEPGRARSRLWAAAHLSGCSAVAAAIDPADLEGR